MSVKEILNNVTYFRPSFIINYEKITVEKSYIHSKVDNCSEKLGF